MNQGTFGNNFIMSTSLSYDSLPGDPTGTFGDGRLCLGPCLSLFGFAGITCSGTVAVSKL